jgi:CHAD domain-containing protein
MKLEIGNVQKPVRKLRQSLKHLPKNPPMEEVHDLRVHARRLEAIVTAVMPGHKKLARRLRKSIKPVRNAAGQVRDLDVLAEHTRELAPRGGNGAVLRLLKYLRELRAECAEKLLDTVAEQRREARCTLKRFCRQIEKQFQDEKPASTKRDAIDAPNGVAAIRLMEELQDWPVLNAENLHAFRIKVKELRYVLQLAEDADPKFVDALGKLKDRIGDWHDWQQLAIAAKDALHPHKDRPTLNKIRQIEKKKLDQALDAARAVRTEYLTCRGTTANGNTHTPHNRSA